MKRFSEPLREYGLIGALSRGLSDPVGAFRYLRQREESQVLPKQQFERPPSPTELVEFISELDIEASHEEIQDIWFDLCDDEVFRSEIKSAFASTTAGPDKFYHNWRDNLYVLIRMVQPTKVVETGIRGGLSSAYILNALACESDGGVVSIDIGDTDILPSDLDTVETGWIVPQRLRSRWDLRIESSLTALPSVLDGDTDVFFSDVPNELLRDELAIAVQEMAPGAIIVTCTPRGSEAEMIWQEFADDALTVTSRATRWESEEERSDLRAGVLGE
jgi:predicted O-methyltransferase YrrM